MERVFTALLFLFNLFFFVTKCDEVDGGYDEPTSQDINDIGENSEEIVSLISSTSTTASPDDNKMKEGIEWIEDFVKTHVLYSGIGILVIVCCLLCSCCYCCRRRRHRNKGPQSGQYAYYTR